jgi:hypothetical protein
MTIARRQLIDVSVTLWYHRMSRCIRGALWLGGDSSDRKSWLVHGVRSMGSAPMRTLPYLPTPVSPCHTEPLQLNAGGNWCEC